MPGIIDANIRTKSAYGSLREAKVNFTCHNLRQLEILELLYMRPGYPVLLEWGWSPHINNNGKITNDFPSIANMEQFWDDKLIDQTFIEREVVNLKRKYNGNYDGFVGFITNFNYNSRPDGGFNCSTELISMGEVLDSLKVPQISFGNKGNKTGAGETFSELPTLEKKQIIYSNTLGSLIQDINRYFAIYDADIIVNNEAGSDRGAANIRFQHRFKDEAEIYADNLPWYSADTAVEDFANDYAQVVINSHQKIIQVLNNEVPSEVIDQMFFGGQDGIVKLENEDTFATKQEYIRWDALCILLNKLVIPLNEKNQSPFIISPDRFTQNNKGELLIEPLLYNNIQDANFVYDVSCDSQICILPHQFDVLLNGQNKDYTFSQKCGLFWDGLKKDDWGPIKIAFGIESTPEIEKDYVGSTASGKTSIEISADVAKRRIGGIFIEVKYLKKIFEDVFLNNKDASLGDFLNKLWKGISENCPLHNFGIRTDFEFNNLVQVIDLPLNSNDVSDLDYNTLFKFNVISNDTIAREFKYSTQIPSAMKSTIAIQAQAGNSADSIDSVTFAAFNKAIKSRLHSYSEKFTEKEADRYNDIQTTRRDKEIRLQDLIQIIYEYNQEFFDTIDIDREGINFDSKYGNIKTIIQEAQNIENYLEKSSTGYLKNQSIIPININLVLDGISGIIIGNVFRVDESRLPKAYRKSNIAFIVLGEEQNITAGQDWVTNIRGQMILFPSEAAQSARPRPQITYEQLDRAYRPATAADVTSQNEQIGQINGATFDEETGELISFTPETELLYSDNLGNNAGVQAGIVAINQLNNEIRTGFERGDIDVTDLPNNTPEIDPDTGLQLLTVEDADQIRIDRFNEQLGIE